MIFSKSPFFRFTLFFILGIVAYHFLGDAVLIKWGILLLAFIAYVFLSIKNTLRHQLLLSSLAFFMLFGLGTWRLASFRDEQKENHLLHVSEGTVAYKAVITSEPAEKQNSIQCKLDVYAIWNGKTWRPVSGLVNGYVSLKKGTTLQYGDLLYVSGSPELTAPPANPGAFNYQQYLSYSRIHHQQFIRDDFEIIGHDTPSWFLDKAFGLRKHSVQQISKYITDEYARGVTLALVLGVKDELEDDLVKAFSATGAMHVLAVSGLHVGIVYAFVFLLLKRLGLSRRKYRWVLALVSVMVLWCYAFLTGLSPSVLRAVTMFTFVAFGKALSRHSNIYNTLAASAMALLLYNPYLLMSVGFQLSYIAVFGIVYLQPKLYSLLVFEHKLLDKVWTITCVSVAAQLATAPLSILYFHQFPTYFLLSNLIVIPAAFLILVLGLSILILSPISFVAVPLAWLLTKSILIVNGLITQISQWPGSTISGIYFSNLDTWILYGVVIYSVLFFVKKKSFYLKFATALALLFGISQIGHYSRYAESSEFSVIDISNRAVIDFRKGFKSKMISDTLFEKELAKQEFNLHPKRLLTGSAQETQDDLLEVNEASSSLGRLFSFEGKIILYLDQQVTDRFNPEEPIVVDCLILGKNAVSQLSYLKGKVVYTKLIIDPTNSWFVDRELSKESEQLQIDYHSVRQNGYYSETWNSSL